MSREYEITIIEEINQSIRAIKANPLELGGVTGSGGGSGGPSGGFIGVLPQGKIAYDLSEDSTLYTPPTNLFPPSGASLVDNLNHIRYRLTTVEDEQYVDRYIQMTVVNYVDDILVGDGIGYIVIPDIMNNMNLVYVHARVITAGTTGTTDIQLANVTDAVDMLSTKLTIDSGETGSETGTPAVIDVTKDDVAEFDLLRIDVDAVSSVPPKGLIITLGFQKV